MTQGVVVSLVVGGFYLTHVKDLIEVKHIELEGRNEPFVKFYNHTTQANTWMDEKRITLKKELAHDDMEKYRRTLEKKRSFLTEQSAQPAY